MSKGEMVMKFKNPDTTSKDMLMTEASSTLLSVGVSGSSYGLANAGPNHTSFTLWHECDRMDSKEGKT